jgi:hypothetical protein
LRGVALCADPDTDLLYVGGDKYGHDVLGGNDDLSGILRPSFSVIALGNLTVTTVPVANDTNPAADALFVFPHIYLAGGDDETGYLAVATKDSKEDLVIDDGNALTEPIGAKNGTKINISPATFIAPSLTLASIGLLTFAFM